MKRRERLALFDLSGAFPILLEVDGMVRDGECNRCGKCCCLGDGTPCEHLVGDIKEGDKTLYSCGLGFAKPVACAVYPKPEDVKIEGCGYTWRPK